MALDNDGDSGDVGRDPSRVAARGLVSFISTFLALTGKQVYDDHKRLFDQDEGDVLLKACEGVGYDGSVPIPHYDKRELATFLRERYSGALKDAVVTLPGVSLDESELERLLDRTVELQEHIPASISLLNELPRWVSRYEVGDQ